MQNSIHLHILKKVEYLNLLKGDSMQWMVKWMCCTTWDKEENRET